MACSGMPHGISASGSGIFLPAAAARMRSQVESNSSSTCGAKSRADDVHGTRAANQSRTHYF